MKRIQMHEVCGRKSKIAPEALVANRASRVGSIPGCIFLAAADVGRARVGRKYVWTSWGRNIPAARVGELVKFGVTPIWMGADDGSVEVVIPDAIAERLLSTLI